MTTQMTTPAVAPGNPPNATPAYPSGHNLTLDVSSDATNPRLVNGVLNLLLMLLNIGGNSLVFYVYNRLTKNMVFALFVRVLAALDLLTAVITMLIDVIMKLRPNDETDLNLNLMCKLSHFQVYANSLTSGCVLTLIAYQRYRKICHPLKRSMTVRKARYLLAGICACCLLACIPSLIVYGRMDVAVRMTSGKVVRTTICRYDAAHEGSILQLFTSYALLLAFSVVLLATVLLYVMVARAIRKFERRNSAARKSAHFPEEEGGGGGEGSSSVVEIKAVNVNDVVVIPVPAGQERQHQPNRYQKNATHGGVQAVMSPVHGRPGKLVPIPIPEQSRDKEEDECDHGKSPKAGGENGKKVAAAVVATEATMPGAASGRPAKHTTNLNQPTSPNRLTQTRASIFSVATSNQVSAQMYRMFAVITVVFIISYLPHLVVLILTKVLSLDHMVLTYGQRLALELAYNCPYISTVSNPLVYGFSSSEFREQLRELFYCKNLTYYCCGDEDEDDGSCCCCCLRCCCCCCLRCCGSSPPGHHHQHHHVRHLMKR